MHQFNPFEYRTTEDEAALLAEMRKDGPVHEIMPNWFMIVSYAEAKQALLASDTFLQGGWAPDGLNEIPADDLVLSQLDPPVHTEVRNNMARALGFRNVKQFEADIAVVANDLAAAVAEHAASNDGTADLVAEFTEPFVARALTLQTGLGVERADRVCSYAKDFMANLATEGKDAARLDARKAEFDAEILAMVERARADPASTTSEFLRSLLTATDSAGCPVSDRRVVTYYTMDLIVAGVVSTIHMLGNLVHQVLSRPGAWDELRADPALRANAVEESLRQMSPVNFLMRRTAHEVSLGGVTIPKDATVLVSLNSANVDDAEFGDGLRYELDRAGSRRHLSFGQGLHMCIGASLVRLETRAALDALLANLPHLELDPDEGYDRALPVNVRGPRHARVRVGVKPVAAV